MAILKLYGGKHATCTKRVATVLHKLKVPFELIEPFGQIPYIEEEDGFVLYETRAICRCIAAKYPASGLIPSEPKAHAIFEQAVSAELTNFDPSGNKLVFETVLKPMFYGTKADPAVLEEQLAILDKKLDAYDVILGKHRYIAGESLTLADLFHIPYAPLLAAGGIDIMTQKPNVARWYKELVARPSWLACTDSVTSTAAY
ncbi:glutathione S-transferase [Mycena rosella]|uniref:glutathione transferase n=1 Tax=Mycena rosella TaxID=1033263 RepID=A0AAD7GZZ7_MYCRO|nr:glutathione S-transferase [Mycena rosella]